MWSTFISPIIASLYNKYLRMYIEKDYFKNKFFYPLDVIKQMAFHYDFEHLGNTKYLKGSQLAKYNSDFFEPMSMNSIQGEKKSVLIPYKEEVNFINEPDVLFTISNLNEPIEKFRLDSKVEKATTELLYEFIEEKNCTPDPHPRISSFMKVGDKHYECKIEEANYFQQIRTNLTLDCKVRIEGKNGFQTMRGYDLKNGDKLPEFSESYLSNTLGVSAIWMMGGLNHEKIFMLPRKRKVGVFENKLGIPSGSAEMPKNNDFSQFPSFMEYLKLEIAREFTEEVGICGRNIDMSKFSKDLKFEPEIIENIEIIPLAFVRELYRGGKPQVFFLITTPEIPEKLLLHSFKKSHGTDEFENPIITSATASLETICNFLYAMKYYEMNVPVPFVS